ncbi:hypothetical protein FB451DRAFT_1405892 [Mycena latifolia]|nr:hypothetical protein FB451DRAFT_1405892 [Mycena latifolia]
MQEERQVFSRSLDISAEDMKETEGPSFSAVAPEIETTDTVQPSTSVAGVSHQDSDESGIYGPQAFAVEQTARVDTADEEQALYKSHMLTFPVPDGLPTVKDLKPIVSLTSGRIDINSYLHEVVGATIPCFYFPKRIIWCPGQQHALVFCPTHLYDPLWCDWWERPMHLPPIGQTRELFVSSGDSNSIIYVGTYTLRSLRHIHPPGSPAPEEVSHRQLLVACGFPDRNPAPGVLESYFAGGVLPTECFGLQRVGFDQELYSNLRTRMLEDADKKTDGGGKKAKKRKMDGLNYG